MGGASLSSFHVVLVRHEPLSETGSSQRLTALSEWPLIKVQANQTPSVSASAGRVGERPLLTHELEFSPGSSGTPHYLLVSYIISYMLEVYLSNSNLPQIYLPHMGLSQINLTPLNLARI